MTDDKKKSKRKCEECNSIDVVPIVYGYPMEELLKEAEEGKVSLGGCCVTDDDPKWHCNACGHEWRYNRAKRKGKPYLP